MSTRNQSHLPELNRRPLPYHGSALPTELRWRVFSILHLLFNTITAQHSTAQHNQIIVFHTGLLIVSFVVYYIYQTGSENNPEKNYNHLIAKKQPKKVAKPRKRSSDRKVNNQIVKKGVTISAADHNAGAMPDGHACLPRN